MVRKAESTKPQKRKKEDPSDDVPLSVQLLDTMSHYSVLPNPIDSPILSQNDEGICQSNVTSIDIKTAVPSILEASDSFVLMAASHLQTRLNAMDSTVKGVAEILLGSLADDCWASKDAFGTIPPMARGKLFVASMRAKKAIQERESSMPLCPDYGAMLELLGAISSSPVRPGLGWAAESVLPPVLFVGMAAHLFRIDRPAVAFADVAETGLDVVVKALALAADPVIRTAGVDPTCAMVARRAAESLETLLAAAPADVRADYDAKQLAAAVAEGVSELPPLLQAEVVRVICVGPDGLGVNAVLKRAAKDTVVRLAGVGVTDTREVARHMAARFAKIRGDFRDTKTHFLSTQEIQTLADDLYVALTALAWFLTSEQTSKVCRALLKVYQQDRQLLSPLQPLYRLIDAGIPTNQA